MKAPKAPDPYTQANAQSGANRDAAISGAIINNVDESSPFGSVSYTQTGTQSYVDSQGKKVKVPTYRRDVTLSRAQQDLYDRQTQAGKNLGDLAVSQSSRLNKVLNKPFNPRNLPRRASSAGIQTNLGLRQDRTGFGYRGPGVQTRSGADIGSAGKIQKDVGPSDFSVDRRRVEDAIMFRYDRLSETQREAHEARLMNQGLTPGSTAWNERMDELNRSRTDATMQAILAGGQEQSRLAGLQIDQGTFRNQAQQQSFEQNRARGLFDLSRMQAENAAQQQGFNQYNVARDYERQGMLLENQRRLQEAQFKNQAQGQKFTQDSNLRNAALQEAFALRNQPINEISALMSGSQVTAPEFAPAYRQAVQSAPIGDYMQQNYQSRLANHQAGMSGLFGLGSSVIGGLFGLSDRRLKDGVSLMAKMANGLGLYLFRYRHNGQWSVGVMAQDVAQVIPDAVRSMGGVMSVDYGEVTKCNMTPA